MAGPLQPGGVGRELGTDREVDTLESSPVWLRNNGLKGSKLTLPQVLAQICFRQKKDYVRSLGRWVCSQYGGGLFTQVVKNGCVYNLTATPEQLEELCKRLDEKARLFRRRLDWLTSGSRQLFGVIQERSAALVVEFGSANGGLFRLSQSSVCMLIREQVSQIAWFNVIRSGPVTELWQETAEYTSPSNIEAAVEWVSGLRPVMSSPVYIANALLAAMQDPKLEAIYLIVMGDWKVDVASLLGTQQMKTAHPIHSVSLNARREETFKRLKELSHLTSGRFHAFAEMSLFEDTSHDMEEGEHGNVSPLHKSLTPIGGMPPGGGVREDVFLVWREVQEALTIRAEIQTLLLEFPSSSSTQDSGGLETPLSEDCLSSKAWLSRNGLRAQKLSLCDALADCAFRHSDSVVKGKLLGGSQSTVIELKKKLVNAKYCSQFAHMKWKDGSVVHVYVSLEKCRWYRDRMEEALRNMQRRLDWLQQGSRLNFGVLLEPQVYILIDTSEPTKDQLPLLKDKFYQLLQEQLRCKAKVNFVAFGSQVVSWRVRLAEVTEKNLESAWNWVQGLQTGGSSNILGALQVAVSDVDTQAVYLLTSSRLDKPLEMLLAQLQLDRAIPIHTVAFNCGDPETNSILGTLSRETGGRFHCHDNGASDDIHILKEEIKQGESDLKTLLRLRAECVMLDWYHNKDNKEPQRDLTHTLQAKEDGIQVCKLGRPKVRTQNELSSHLACRDRTELREFLERGFGVGDGASFQDWMLPETLSLFQMNVDKQKSVLDSLKSTPVDDAQKTQSRRKATESLDVSTARWLQKNSLVARRLTIMDALAPAAVQQRAKYIPILDKNVYSKVFDEFLQLAQVSSDSSRVALLNPLAVDLEEYKARLQENLAGYERRLDSIIWRALNEEERNKFGSNKPVAFREHREALLKALEDLGWPLPREDVDQLEDQVHLSHSFIQQASDLQQAIKEKAHSLDPDPVSKAATGTVKAPVKKRGGPLDSFRGQRAIGRSEKDGFYYAGTVRKRLRGERVLMDFRSSACEVIPLRFLITVGGSGPCPPLAVGDFVFVGAGNDGTGDCFVPGVVIATPCRLEAKDKLYTVFKYNDRKVDTRRNRIIKVSQSRYALTCRYIRERDRKHDGASEDQSGLLALHQPDTLRSLSPTEAKLKMSCRTQGRSKSQRRIRQTSARRSSYWTNDEDGILRREECERDLQKDAGDHLHHGAGTSRMSLKIRTTLSSGTHLKASPSLCFLTRFSYCCCCGVIN